MANLPGIPRGPRPKPEVTVFEVEREQYDLAYYLIEAVNPGALRYGNDAAFSRPDQDGKYIVTVYKLKNSIVKPSTSEQKAFS
jgi:hypothetical protein